MFTKFRTIIFLLILGVALNLSFVNISDLDSGIRRATGLKKATPEEKKAFKSYKIKKIRLNSIGLERVNRARAEQGLAPIPAPAEGLPEYETDQTLGATSSTTTPTGDVTYAAASATGGVDNSALASFPAIGDQSTLQSCVSWASTYYLMSHEVCLSLGCSNKTTGGKIFSPRWTYNQVNNGYDTGSGYEASYELLERHGAALLSERLYSTSDYRSWDLNTDHWKNAMKYRLQVPVSFNLYQDADVAKAKDWLTNGHVINIGTFIYSFVYSTVKSNPNVTSDPFAGQSVISYIKNNQQGAHAMTIVGFNDNIWTDINGNGLVDAGELGAFKIANQWGTGWGNSGYIWASYDSFRSVSAVSGFAPLGRGQMVDYGSAYGLTYTPYSPKIMAKFVISHLKRNQILVNLGASSAAVTTPEIYWQPGVFNWWAGGAFAFDGGTTEIDGTFYFDATQIMGVDPTAARNFYFRAQDTYTGDSLIIREFSIIDAVSGATLATASGLPVSIDNVFTLVMASSAGGTSPTPTPTPSLSDTIEPSVPTGVTASLVASGKGKKSTTVKVNLTWQASSDNVGVAKYIIYRNNVKLAESTSLSYVDTSTSTSTGMSYSYQISAVDAAGNESAKSLVVTISR